MGLRVAASFLGLIALGAGIYLVTHKAPEPIEILATGRLPAGTTHLDLSQTPTYRAQWNFQLLVKSNFGAGVRLEARLEDPAPAEWKAKLLQNSLLLPGGEIKPTLALFPSHKVGPFSGRVTVYSDDVPDWGYTWTFSGEVVNIPHAGRHLTFKPVGFDLKDCKSGDEREILLTLHSGGDKAVTVHSIEPDDERRIKVAGFTPGRVIPPGGQLDLPMQITIPDASGVIVFKLTIRSDAGNAKVREIRVRANVVPDYACNPVSIHWRNVYRRKQPQLRVQVTGVKPFRVTRVFSDQLLEVVSLGSETLQSKQTVTMRLRRDAPIGPVQAVLRLRIEPAGIETKVPLEMVVMPAVYAAPVDFGRVQPGGAVAKRDVHFYSMDQRSFKITSAVAKRGLFGVEVALRAGMTPILKVYPLKNLGQGTHWDRIVVKTDHPDVPELRVPVVIVVR